MQKIIKRLFLSMVIVGMMFASNKLDVHAEDVVVVIDPGHGGENLGGQWAGHDEKDLTMVTAKAMKDYLELFDGITVYMTREDDRELSLQERADFAAEKDADFLFCIHYNMSEEHTLFGAEVWVSAFGEMFRKGYTFADVQMKEFDKMGLYSRGIKTRLNDKGTDYYGILRNCTALNIPAVIIEHCHLDQANDTAFWNSEEKLQRFGVADATAVAKYFRLKSETLGLDYSDYENIQVAVPADVVRPDTVPPEYCTMTLDSVDYKTGEVKVSVEAADADTVIHYVDFSLDGGATWQDLQAFDGTKRTFTLQVRMGSTPTLVARAYDLYDLKTESEPLRLNTFTITPTPVDPEEEIRMEESKEAAVEEATPDTPKDVVEYTVQQGSHTVDLVMYGLIGVLVALLVLLCGFLISIFLTSRKMRRRKKSHTKVSF